MAGNDMQLNIIQICHCRVWWKCDEVDIELWTEDEEQMHPAGHVL